MMNLKNLLSIAALASTTVLAGCGATTSSDGDATDGTSSDATTGDTTGDTSGATDDASTGDTTALNTYAYIVIYDSEKPDCSTTGPGADIDGVELIAGGSTIGVGLKGSANYAASNPNNVGTCTMCGKNADKECAHGGDKCDCADSAMGAPDAKLYCGNTVDTGYISLNGGSIEFAIGDANGGGKSVTIQSGDHIKVHEVDEDYKYTDDGSKCNAPLGEKYEVWLRTAKGLDTGSVKLTAVPAADGSGTTEFVVP